MYRENRKEYTTQHLLLSTKALEGDQNAILDYSIQLSNHNYEADIKLYKEEGSSILFIQYIIYRTIISYCYRWEIASFKMGES